MDTADAGNPALIEFDLAGVVDDLGAEPTPHIPGQRQPQPAGVNQIAPAVTGAPAVVADGLTDRERQVLAFERQWWRHAGAKEQAIRDLFDVPATRYYQMLNALLDKPAALAHDPVLVKRLRRLRSTRTRARTGGRWAT